MKNATLFKGLSLVSFFLVIGLWIFQFLASKDQVVFVNSGKILNEYQGMINARKSYEQKALTWKANIDTLERELKAQVGRYEQEKSSLTKKEQELTRELIRNKQGQVAQYQQAMNAQAQQEDARMTGEVVAEINAFLERFGKERGYKIILAATEYGNLAYADDGLDVTEAVVEGLNKAYSGK